MSVAPPLEKKKSSSLYIAHHHLLALDLVWASFFLRVQLISLLLISPGLCVGVPGKKKIEGAFVKGNKPIISVVAFLSLFYQLPLQVYHAEHCCCFLLQLLLFAELCFVLSRFKVYKPPFNKGTF